MSRHEQHDFAPAWEKAFTDGVKRERLAQGMTQAELAERMSDLGYPYHQATVYKIENNERKVTAAEAYGLAEILDVSIDYLFNWEAAHGTPAAHRRLIRTQADRVLQELLALDDSARRLRKTHRAFVDAVNRAEDLTEHRTVNHAEVPIKEFYEPLLALTIQNEVLWRLRSEIWTDDYEEAFNVLAGDISGIVALGPPDEPEEEPTDG